jgi:SAM-dependent methyltransferase
MARQVIGRDVLDVGFSQHPNPYIEAENLVGLDLEECPPPANYSSAHSGNALELPEPFSAESFDCVVAGEILEHVREPIRLLESFQATLRPGGRLVLSTPNPHSPAETVCNVFLNRSILYSREHITLYPQRWLIRMLELSGFEKVKLMSGGIQCPLVGTGRFPRFGLIPFPRPFCYQTIAVATKPNR